MPKKVLILNTSHNDLRMILALKELGFYVIATGGIAGLCGQKYVDQYIQADYSNKENICRLAKELNIDFICACCNDLGVFTASFVAQELGLPGYDSYETVLTLHHKDKFKEFAFKNGILTPNARGFSKRDAAVDFAKTMSYPIIVKPADMSAGRGVLKAENFDQACAAIDFAFSVSREKAIVLEEFIEGSQHGFCTFLIDKKVAAVCSNNEYSFVNPYRVEIDTFPSSNFLQVKDFLVDQIEKTASLLNLTDGILHLQYRMKDGKPYIIEMMRRVLGNVYMEPAQKLTNINFDLWQAKVYCGLDIADFPRNNKQEGFYAYRCIMAKQNGFAREIVIPEKFKKYIFDECIIWDKNIPIKDFQAQPLALLFMKFSSRKEMDEVLLRDYEQIFAR